MTSPKLAKKVPAKSPAKSPAKIRARNKSVAIDWHTHILLPEVFKQTCDNVVLFGYKRKPSGLPASTGAYGGMVWEPDVKKRLKAMDNVGIDLQVVSSSNVHQCCDWAPVRQATAIHRLLNDQIATLVDARPDRFAGLATVPLQSVSAAIKELDRVVSKLGLHGVNISSHINGKELDHESLHPFWKKAQDLGVPIYIHPAGAKDERLQRYFRWNSLGQPYEEAIAITALIYGGVLDKFPKLDFVMAHGGGFVPHYDGRLDRNYHRGKEYQYGLKKPPSEYLKRFYFDTCVYNPEVYRKLNKIVGAGRMIMGSDFPVGEFDPIAFVKKDRSLSKVAEDKIIGKTAAKLLKIKT